MRGFALGAAAGSLSPDFGWPKESRRRPDVAVLQSSMLETAGWVFVGGKSSRFGRDKALLPWRGRPLALHVAEEVRAAAGSVTLVGDPETYGTLGLAVIGDSVREFGPVGGLLAVLDAARARWNLVAACDMPHLSEGFLRFLLVRAAESGADVVLPLGEDGLPQPLCAVYAATARETIQAAVERDEHKVTRAFEGLRLEKIPAPEYANFNEAGNLLVNVNRPEDLCG